MDLSFHFPTRIGTAVVMFRPFYDKSRQDFALMWDVGSDTSAFQVGDEVTVEVPEAANVRAGVIVYVVPVAGLLLGYAAGALVGGAVGWNPDVLGAVGAVAAVSAGLLLLRRSGRSVLAGARYRPRVRAIIAPGLSPSPKAGSNENHPSEPV